MIVSGRAKPVVLIVIDGLTPSMLEATDAPALRFLLDHGTYRRAASTFPSLTPVCLASIATGGHPDVHGIPHLVWWHRGEERLVEYGSSFAALRASGLVQGLRDTVVNLNERHLSRSAETVYEALEGAGLTTAAINITTYRGRHRHLSPIPGFPPVHGPKRFFFYSVYESDRTGRADRLAQPGARLDRRLRGHDRPLARHARRLRPARLLPARLRLRLTRARPGRRPRGARAGRRGRSRRCSRRPAGATPSSSATPSCSAPTTGSLRSSRSARLTVDGALVTASNRAAMLYGDDPRRLAEALDGEPSVDVALFLENGEVVARRDGDEDLAILDEYPDGRARAEGALRNPNAGEVLVSAAAGWEFGDLGGRHHVGGGSHGALATSDSEVPMLTVGLGEPPASITEIKALLLEHFGGRASPRCAMNDAEPGSTASSAAAASTTSASSTRWHACRASCSFPRSFAPLAYDDAPVPLPFGQTVSQPYMVALICQSLGLAGDERVLDVGTGSGYQAAVLAELAREVHSIERIPELAECRPVGARRRWLRPGAGARRRRLARPALARAVRRDRRCRGRRGGAPGALGPARRRRSHRAPLKGGRRDQRLCVLQRTPDGPRLLASVPARFVPLVTGRRRA